MKADVLILVVMEYALRVIRTVVSEVGVGVLILVVMEYALREVSIFSQICKFFVLILVVMEYALRGTYTITADDGTETS